MAASLTISLSPDVLRLLADQKVVTVVAGGSVDNTSPSARAGLGTAPRPGANGSRQVLRPGSHAAKLLAWAASRKPFGVADVMKALKVKRAHASMILTKLVSVQALEREGRGSYRSTQQ